MKPREFLRWGSRLILAGLFAYSGAIKLLDPAAFAQAVAGYELLSSEQIPLVTFWIPWMEVWCAVVLLWVPLWRRSASVCLMGLLIGFTVLKLSALLRGLEIDCGCAGSGRPLDGWSVAENVVWISVGVVHLLTEHRGLTRKG